MDFNKLQSHAGEWLGSTGPESDIVISSRVRLARNVSNFPFLSRVNAKERTRLEAMLKEQIEEARPSGKLSYFSLPSLSQVDRLFLVERHLISREHAFGRGPRGVAIGPNETISIMINEEDHLRLQALRSGLQLRKTWDEINLVDDRMEELVDYAFSPQFGYLTVCRICSAGRVCFTNPGSLACSPLSSSRTQ